MPRRIPLLCAALLLICTSAGAACSVSGIAVKSSKARFVNKCSAQKCLYMTGVAVLTNHCAEAVGVEVEITAFDKAGSPVSTQRGWPNSVANIPPGDFTFSLDQWLEYVPNIATFEMTVVGVKQWKQR